MDLDLIFFWPRIKIRPILIRIRNSNFRMEEYQGGKGQIYKIQHRKKVKFLLCFQNNLSMRQISVVVTFCHKTESDEKRLIF